ncbi:tetratricopeptide repeat protein 19, mitochondrial-like [Styela clava]
MTMWGRISGRVCRVATTKSWRPRDVPGSSPLQIIPECNHNNTEQKFPNLVLNNRRNDYKKHNSGNSKITFPFLVLIAASINHEETDLEETKLVGDGNRDIALLIMKGRKMLKERCSFEKIEEVYIEALHLALTRKDRNTIAYVQDQLANLALRFNKLEKAEELFKHVIRNLLDGGIKENDRSIIEISLKLATIYAATNKHDLAISGYNWTIESCRSNLEELKKTKLKTVEQKEDYDNQFALLGMTLDSYGRYHFAMGRSKEALEVTKEAKDISIKLFGENDIRTLVLYNDIGSILSQMGNIEEATEILEKVVSIANKTKNIDHGDLAVFWVNLCGIFNKQGEKKKAIDALRKARKEANSSNDRTLQKQIDIYINELGMQ